MLVPRKILCGVLLGLLFCCQAVLSVAEPKDRPSEKEVSSEKAPPSNKKPAPKITISKETTFITGPLNQAGDIDFEAAVNAQASAGVTPENNGAILFWQVFGPKEIDEKVREKYFRYLGIDPLPVEGDYLIHFNAYLDLVAADKEPGQELLIAQEGPDSEQARELRLKYEKQSWDAEDRPWSRDEFPLVAAWMAKNDAHLDRLLAATARSRFYMPLVVEDENEGYKSLLSVLFEGVQASRTAARMLACRAMLHMSEGKLQAAQADLLAIHRLGLFLCQGNTLVESLVGYAIEGIAQHHELQLIERGKLTSAELLAYAAQLRALPARQPIVERLNFTERLMFLDCAVLIARGGFTPFAEYTGEEELLPPVLQQLVTDLVKWDELLRMANKWYDRLVAAGRETEYAQQQQAVAQVEQDLQAFIKDARDMKRLTLRLFATGSTEVLTEQMTKLMLSLLFTGTTSVFQAEHRIAVRDDLNQLALALAAHRADLGKYPAELASLKPKYLAKLPLDRFAAAPFRYRVMEEGYLLYSIGPNGVDDGGRTMADGEDGEYDSRLDDLPIRMPLPAEE